MSYHILIILFTLGTGFTITQTAEKPGQIKSPSSLSASEDEDSYSEIDDHSIFFSSIKEAIDKSTSEITIDGNYCKIICSESACHESFLFNYSKKKNLNSFFVRVLQTHYRTTHKNQ